MQQPDLEPYTFAVNVQLGLYVGPLTSGMGSVSISIPCHWIYFPCLDCLVGPQWKRMYLVLLRLDIPVGCGTYAGLPFSE